MSSIMCFSYFGFILIDWMLGLLFLDFKIGYLLRFVCQLIQLKIWFLKLDISCNLFFNKYNWWFDFIHRKQRRAYFRFLNIGLSMIIFSMIVRLNYRLSCSRLRKINDHEYMLIWINNVDSKALIPFS